VKPYKHVGLSPKQKKFNWYLSKARVVVEQAYGHLKGQWHCLLKRVDHHIENVPYVTSSCVTLHNVCELFGDNFQDNWLIPRTTEHHSSTVDSSGTPTDSIRKALEDYLYTN